MLVVEHKNNIIVSVKFQNEIDNEFTNLNIVNSLFSIAKKYPHNIIAWFDSQIGNDVNFNEITELLNTNRKLISYNPFYNYFPDEIGYIEESPFINVNKQVTYATWQMSSLVGATYTNTILSLDLLFFNNINFDYFLNSISKHYMPLGLFCYSEPRLLLKKVDFKYRQASKFELFKFINQHYKFIWKLLLFMNVFIYQKKIWLFPFFKSLFFKKERFSKEIYFENIIEEKEVSKENIDIIIPTIGRKKYLYDVLKDLNIQSHLPKNVIIVEQNPLENSGSELDYLNESWNFKIKHLFTHQAGACNARNEALKLVENEWIFFADDDIRLQRNFIKEGLTKMIKNQIEALVFKTLNPNDKEEENLIDLAQTTIFGTCTSFIKFKEKIFFNTKLEFGYGEDTEYGLQLRKKGVDIFYTSSPVITHLKAPVGGFRYKHVFPWDNQTIKPIPVPTILLYKKENYTRQQVLGFKTVLFLNLLRQTKKMFFLSQFKKSWDYSNYWANRLENEN